MEKIEKKKRKYITSTEGYKVLDEDNFGGIYNKKNKLNDLTGSSWQYWTKTVIDENYPSGIQHKLRAEHGGQKSPELCADLIKIFTKKNAVVLDPLMGVGGTLLGAAISNRRGIGIEINGKWVDIYKKVCVLEKIEMFPTYVGNALNELEKIDKESVDFVLTDVPYWIMDKLKKTRSKGARKSNLSEFNNETLQTKEDWLSDMKKIFIKTNLVLKKNGYMAVFIGDLYTEKEFHLLAADLAKTISEIDHLKLKSDIIWVDKTKGLHIYGYPSAYIPSLIHQHILIFRKEQ